MRLTLLASAAAFCALGTATLLAAGSTRIGEVSTNFRFFGSDDKIVIEAFEDPRVPGVTCHLSRVTTGGINPFAEDGSDASIACRQTGPVVDANGVPVKIADLAKYDKEDVFSASQNLWFKTMHVRRFVDQPHNTLVYLTFSDKLINGSPKNAISSVPIMPWTAAAAR